MLQLKSSIILTIILNLTDFTSLCSREELFSLHPFSQKRGTIINMTDRSFLLSHLSYHQKNLEFVVNTLLNNDYSLNFILDTVNLRFKYLLGKHELIFIKKSEEV